MRAVALFRATLLVATLAGLSALHAQTALVVKPAAERKVSALPEGTLHWRVESFPSLAQAQAAAGPHGVAAEAWGKSWLFTLGPPGGSTSGGAKVAEIGPIPKVSASEYLLRVNVASGQPGSASNVHSHPGSEAFYVLEGEQSIRTPDGVLKVKAGSTETGPGADTPLQVSSSGTEDLKAIVLFAVDANRPFSSPATIK